MPCDFEVLNEFDVIDKEVIKAGFESFGEYFCIENERELEFTGAPTSLHSKALQFMLLECEPASLAEGETCMSESEKTEYYQSKELAVWYLDSMIDFEDISSPVKTAVKMSTVRVDTKLPQAKAFFLKIHNFDDNVSQV